MIREEYLNTLQQKLPSNLWQAQLDYRRKTQGNFTDDIDYGFSNKRPVLLRPNDILTYDVSTLSQEEQEYYNNFSNENDIYQHISDLFVSNHVGTDKDFTSVQYGGLGRTATDSYIRSAMNLQDDEEINYGQFVTAMKMKYPEKSNNWVMSPYERYSMQIDPYEFNALSPKEKLMVSAEAKTDEQFALEMTYGLPESFIPRGDESGFAMKKPLINNNEQLFQSLTPMEQFIYSLDPDLATRDEKEKFVTELRNGRDFYKPTSNDGMVSEVERMIAQQQDKYANNQFWNNVWKFSSKLGVGSGGTPLEEINAFTARLSNFATEAGNTFLLAGGISSASMEEKIKNNIQIGKRGSAGEFLQGSASGLENAQITAYRSKLQKQYGNLVALITTHEKTASPYELQRLYKRLEEVNQAFKELDKAVGNTNNFSNQGWLERAFKEGAAQVPHTLDTLQLFALSKGTLGKVPKTGQFLTMIPNIGYWQETFSGDIMHQTIGDRDIQNISQKELSNINNIAQLYALPAAGVEYIASAFPALQGLGGLALQNAKKKLFKLLLKGGGVGRGTVALGAVGVGGVGYYVERLEEYAQEFITDQAVQLGFSANEIKTTKDAITEMFNTDIMQSHKAGKLAFEESKYAVLFMSGFGTVHSIVDSQREYNRVENKVEELRKQGFGIEESYKKAIELEGLVGRKSQKKTTIEVEAKKLTMIGTTQEKANEIATNLANATTKQKRKDALKAFHKEVITQNARLHKASLDLDNTSDVSISEKEIDALAEAYAETFIANPLIQDELLETAENLQKDIFKNYRIKLTTETLVRAGVEFNEAKQLANRIENTKGKEERVELQKELYNKIRQNSIEGVETLPLPYSQFGYLTDVDFENLKKLDEDEIAEVIENFRRTYRRIAPHLLPEFEQSVDLLFKAIRGDAEAQAEYNEMMDVLRDKSYARFLKAFQLTDGAFQLSPENQEEIDNETDEFVIPEEIKQRIRELDPEFLPELEEIQAAYKEDGRDITLEEAAEIFIARAEQDVNTEQDIDDDARRKELSEAVEKARQSIKDILPDVKIIIAQTTTEFNEIADKLVGEEAEGAGGVFITGDNQTIVIDASIAKPEIVAHEVFHALFDSVINSYIYTDNIDVAFEERAQEVLDRVRPYLDEKTQNELDEHLQRYQNDDYKGEEGLAKIVEILARNYRKLPEEEKNIIIRFIEFVMERMGLGDYTDSVFNLGFKTKKNIPKKDRQVINLLQSLAVAIAEGKTIRTNDLSLIRPDLEQLAESNDKENLIQRAEDLGVKVDKRMSAENILAEIRKNISKRKMRASKVKIDKKKLTQQIGRKKRYKDKRVKNVSVIENFDVNELDGIDIATVMCDRLFGGAIGDELFLGGIYFPMMTGRVWAANKGQATNIIKSLEQQNPDEQGGYYYIVPIIMNEDSHLSNRSSARQIFLYFEQALKSPDVDKEKFYKTFQERMIEIRDSAPSKKQIGLQKDAPTVKQKIQEALDSSSNMEELLENILQVVNIIPFSARKNLVTSLLNYEQLGASIGLDSKAVAAILADPKLDGVVAGEFRTVIRFKKMPKIIEVKKGEQGYHDSYAEQLDIGDSEIEVLFLNRDQDITSVMPVFTRTYIDKKGKEKVETIDVREYIERTINTPNTKSPRNENLSLSFARNLAVQKKNLEGIFSSTLQIKNPIEAMFPKHDEPNIPEVKEASVKLINGEISREEYLKIIRKHHPAEKYKKLPQMPSQSVLQLAVKRAHGQRGDADTKKTILHKKVGYDNLGETVETGEKADDKKDIVRVEPVILEEGDQVSARLDVPTYNRTGQYAVTIHRGASGKSTVGGQLGYVRAIRLVNVTFESDSLKTFRIQQGQSPKVPISRIEGTFSWKATSRSPKDSDKSTYENRINNSAQDIIDGLKDKQGWVQIGFNPKKFGYFFERGSMRPVKSAKEVIQVGGLVFARGVEYANENDPEFALLDENASNEVMKNNLIDAGIKEEKVYKARYSRRRISQNEKVNRAYEKLLEKIKSIPREEDAIKNPKDLSERAGSNSIVKDDIERAYKGFGGLSGRVGQGTKDYKEELVRVANTYTEENIVDIIDKIRHDFRANRPIAVSTDDIIALALYKAKIENNIERIDALYKEAVNKGNQIELDRLDLELSLYQGKLDDVLQAADTATTTAGQLLKFVQLTQTTVDLYSFAALKYRVEQLQGSSMTPDQAIEFKELASDLVEINRKISLVVGEAGDAVAGDIRSIAEGFIKYIKSELKGKDRKLAKDASKLQREKIAIKKAIRDLGLFVNDNVKTRFAKVGDEELNPSVRKQIGLLAKVYIAEAINQNKTLTLDTLIKRLGKDLPELSESTLLDVIASRNPQSIQTNSAENQRLRNELQSQAEQKRKLIKDLEKQVTKKKKLTAKKLKYYRQKIYELRFSLESSGSKNLLDLIRRLDTVEAQLIEASSKAATNEQAQERLNIALNELREIQKISKIQQQIDELQSLLDLDKDEFKAKAPVPKPKEIKQSKELKELLIKRSVLQGEVKKRLQNIAPKGASYWFRNIASIPRNLLATADWSYAFRQFGFVFPSHPILFTKSFIKAAGAFFNPKYARLVDQRLRTDGLYEIRSHYGVFHSDIDGAPNQKEEDFQATILRKVPILGLIIRASDRHASTMANTMRSAMFNQWYQNHLDSTEKERSDYGRWLNISTGRGELNAGNLQPVLDVAMFSPKFVSSKFEAPYMAVKMASRSPAVRAEIAKQWVAFVGTGLGILAMASAMGAEVEDDPEDSDFGKIKIGNRRWDIWGGYVQLARLVALSMKHVGTAYDIEFMDWDDEEVKRSYKDVWFKFFQYKANPIINNFEEVITGKDSFTREEIDFTDVEDLKEQAWDLAPIMLQTINDANKMDLSAAETASIMIPEFLGIGASVYKEKGKKVKTPENL